MKHESVHQFFSRIASELPTNIAIEAGLRQVSYRELEEKSNSLANFLLAKGASAGAPVAVLTDDRVEILIAVLGILKGGCVFAPLDPQIPEKRLETMLTLLAPEWFITESQFLGTVNNLLKETDGHARVICLDTEVDACCLDRLTVLADYASYSNPVKPVVESQPDDMSYVYFTSGSTGQPKAIAGRLKGIDHFIRWEIKTLGLDSSTRVSQMLPPSFDGSLRDIFIPLCTGGIACAPPEQEILLETGKLIEWLESQRINVIHCVPSLFRSLLNEGLVPENFKSLKYILMAGEPLLPSDVKRWTDIFGERIQLINLYGTSETTMAKFAYFVKPADQERRSIPVGKPIEGAAAVVVDKRGRPCPAGIIGEIYIRTPYRALGYYNQPELTQAAFVQNPFNDDPNDIVYKTGDLGRVLEDGNFEYLGRLDRQVKIRGNRVELSEIEDVLRGHASITDVAVIDREDSSGHNYLCAYVVGAEVDTDELRELVLKHLPDYMVPSAFIVMESLPRTISGKIDRQALPLPGRTRAGMDEYVEPSTAVEKVLAGIWTEVLGIEQVGIHDNFFQLGGHSLRATQILSRVRAALRVEVPLRSLFETPTIAGLAALIGERQAPSDLQSEPIKLASRQEPLPLSFAQQRLWFFDQLEPGSWAYNLPLAVRLSGRLNVKALERTLSEIVRRHEALRTTFSVVDDTPIQIISAPAAVPLTFIDLSALPEKERESEARLLAEHESRLPFDLSQGPLLRAALIKLSEQEHIALLTMHHIISDGWSMGVLVSEVVALYEAYAKDEQSPLAELSVQYADYAVWQRGRLQGEVLEEALSYWRERLANVPRVLELPTDRPRSARQSHRGSRLTFAVNEELTEKLRELSQREGVTLFMLVLAAWQFLLSRYSGQQDIVVGAPIANRNRADIENLIGFFVNTLALRVQVAAEENFLQLLARVREVTLGAYKHQELPFERVVEELHPERQFGFQPLFQVMFVYQNMPPLAQELAGLTLGQVEMSDESAVRSDIDFYLWEGESLRGSFIYSTELFDESTIAAMSNRLLEVLEEIVASPEASLGDLLVGSRPEPLALSLVGAEATAEKSPFSYHQERMWFIDQFENGNVYESAPTYHNIPLILHLQGEVDSEVLESSLNEIVERHAVLRTRFISEDGRGWQLVASGECLELKVVDAPASLPDALEIALTEAREPFALDQDLPIRATIFRLSATEVLLLLTVHHIVADRQSLQLIGAELAEIYNARSEGRTASLPELQVQYAHYASSQRNLLDADFSQLWFYWKWQLRGQLAALKLPEDRPRPAIHTYTAARETFTLDATLVQRLAERAGGNDLAAMLAAFKVLLHRYARQDEIVVGTSEPCRTQSEIANVVGPFANLVVLRSDLGGNPAFHTLVQRLLKTVAQACAHQEMPFDKLVQLLNPEKDMSRTALFDVLFQFDDEAEPVFSLGETQARQIDTNFGYGKYDLNLLVRRSGEGFTVTAVYNSDIYDAWNIRQMLRHFEVLIETFALDPEQGIDDTSLLSIAEEQQQLSGWNDTNAAYPADKTIHQLFAEQVARTPDKIAVTFGDEQLTYRELDERANRLAHYLQRQGVGPNKLVALCLTKSPEMIVSLLAVLKAGGAYLPLDPANPAERLQFVVEDSGTAHLITSSELAANVPLTIQSTVLLDTDREAILSQPSTAPDMEVGPHDQAYCIYTSGSTGKPKGALIEHRNVVRLMVNDRLQFSFTSADVWTMFHSYSFDFSVWEMYGALLYGGRLVIVPEHVSKDPALFLDLLIAEGVTVLNQTPTAFYNLSSLDLKEERGAGSTARYVIFGGEALRPALLREWKAAYPGVKLINMYGITETTVHVTFKEIGDEDIASDTSNIGVPISTTTTYIFDDQLRLLPVGVPGEICVGGGGVCRGYLGRDELTRKKFVVNPYKPEETIYRSGDLGKLLPSGEMVYMGRSDDQVQIRGFRVEPGEVQSQLLTHPLITRAEVIARTMHHGAVELVAYVVASGDLDVTELRAHVGSALPHYMVPSAFVFVAEMPLTPNGKVDRRALPEPDQMRPDLGAAFVAPRTPTEEILASIWAEVLGLSRVGAQDNFFELGGHSLLATQVTSRIRTVFNLELPLRNVFEGPTVAELAHLIDTMTAASSQVSGPAMVRVSREQPLPLSFAQQRLWFLHQLEPHSAAYNMHTSLRISGPLNLSAFKQTVTEIIDRHEILRTIFITREGEPFQIVTAPDSQVLSVVDLRHLDSETRQAQARQLATEESRWPFDLTQGPLLRVILMRLSEDEHVIAFTMHHIVSDGWSMGLLIEEMTKLYEAFTRNEPSPLPELSIQYADFAYWQRQWLRGEMLDGQLAYWEKKLARAQTLLELPTDRPRPAAQSYRGATTTLMLSPSLSDSLKELSKGEGATLFMTLLAAFNILLYRYTNQEDILVGTDVANRNRRETEPLLGFFINQLVLRTDLSGDPNFLELLGRVRDMSLEAYAHQDLPFEKLVEALQPERHLSRSPLFQTKLVLQNVPTGAFDLPDLTLHPLEIENNTSRIDLTLAIKDGGDYLSGSLEYSTELFDERTVKRMLSHYETLLASIAANPEKRISELPLLGEAELNQLLDQSAGTKEAYPKGTCIHELFALQAEKTPDAIALIFEDQSLTYAELNQRANQLAHYLLELGVREEMLVGLCARRSVEMIVGMLGILKAGAAYLPLDPSYPLERIAFMLEDAQVAVLLTQEELLESLPSHWAQVVCLDSDAEMIAEQSCENLTGKAKTDNLAYVIYTSGSTGKPKGVMVQHAGLCNLVYAQIAGFDIRSESRVLQFASSSFDASVSEVFTALVAGATLTLGQQDAMMPGGELEKLLRDQKVTTATFPPTVLRVLDEEQFADLKVVVAAGESLDKDTAERWRKRSNGARLIDAYGPTEATVCATMGDVQNETVSIGKPIANGSVYILDEHMRLVPPGVIGELYVGGAGIARGYLNRPDLTAEKFVPDPFRAGRLYRTGDLGRWLANGEIEFLGRIDHQVKVRGYRIETGEIEAMLNNHPEIMTSLVIAREDNPGEKQLVAYCVSEESARQATPIADASGNGRLELWPSVAEFYIYDDLLYHAMTEDSLRNESYKVAINRHVPGKVVLDIGTGKDAILSRFCVEAGAAKVYAIELLEETYVKAKATIESLGLTDKITLIHGNSMEVELPEKIDVCVSEIVGPIGGSEGATQIINNAWRFMKDDGVMIPERSLTKIAAITLPEDFLAHPGFTNVSAQYVEKVFNQIGHRFDLRLCMRNFSKENIISNSQAFEDLDFSRQIEPEYEHEIDLLINRDENLVGFVVWLNLHTVAEEVIDILEGEYCWLPVYLPVFYPGIEVCAGDRITGKVRGRFSDNNLNLDYTVSGRVYRQDGEIVDFEYTTYHHQEVFQATEFHQKIFPDGGINTLTSDQPKALTGKFKTYLRDFLPDYMIPSVFVMMDALPLSPNGKVDRRALPSPENVKTETERPFVAPRNTTEELLAGIWSEVLKVAEVGIHDNFFELGGDSILSIQIITRANRVGLQLTTKQIFQYQTIAQLAAQAGTSETEEAILDAGLREPFSLISAEDRARMPEGVEDAYPLAMMQAGMIFHSEFTPEAPLYHSINTFNLRAPFDADALVQAVADLAAIHEVMRTSVDLAGFSEPLQLVHEHVDVPVGVTDLRDLSEAAQEEALEQWLDEEKRNFSWGEVPMVRFHLHRRTDDTFQFTFTAHHAIFDGWSDGLFLTELFRHYLALIKDKQTAELAALASRFRDFVALERAALESPETRAFWQSLLSESKPLRVPRWPMDQMNGEQSLQVAEVGSGVVSSIEMTLNERVSEGLRQLARRASVPLKSVLLAAHLRVLSLIGGDRDVVTGVVSNGRPETTDGERVIGMFLNSLPFRLALNGGTWEDLVAETFRAERELLPHRRYPLSQIQRENGGRALFETCFNYVHFHVLEGVARLSDVEVLSTGGAADTNFTLMVDFNLKTQNSEIDVVVACDESKIGPVQARLIAGYYRRLLEAMAQAPAGEHYASCSILSEAEEQKLLVEFNDTSVSYPDAVGMHRLFEAQVERTPDATALVMKDERLSYRELNQRANRLAHHLSSLGVNAEQRVGILLERSTSMVVSVLAVLKAGGCYVPLDAMYPAERLSYMMADAGLTVLLTTRALAESLPVAERTFAVVHVDEPVASESAENLGVEVSGQQMAYITYTSGSTGQPKGVMVSHGSAINAFRGWEKAYELHATSSHLQMASFAFDVFTGDLVRTLFTGGKLVVCPTELLLDPPALYALMLAEEVDCAEFTPAVLRNLIQYLEETGQRLDFMRLLAAGSDTWFVKEFNQVKQLCAASTRVINSYGVTEATIDSTYFESADLRLPAENLTPIGRPFANVTAYVLDADHQLVPTGTPGELYLGGAGLARGYWQRPELTAEKFIPDNFSAVGGRLYRTGDLARYLENGELEFLGRADHQVKVRGYRIELGEIESVLRQQDQVREAVVLAREESSGPRLVAYVVSEAASSAELREQLRQRLPEYMVPAAFVMLDELPLTPNGKIDRKALPAPERETGERARFVAARTPLEELIAEIWREVLALGRVSTHDNFFELGGHSLLATRVISRVRALGQVELPLRTLFESPTIAELARRVEEARRSQSGQAQPTARIARVERPESGLPLSFAQQRLWFLDQLEPGSSAYNIPAALLLNGELDRRALEQTLTEIVRRHEVLRTSFPARDGEPVQFIWDPAAVEMPVLDLSDLHATEREREARRLAEEEAFRPFDLEHGPLFRVRLLCLGEQQHMLLLTLHHIVSDAWSTGVLLREAQLLYSAYAHQQESPLEELPIQYGDFTMWQRDWLTGEVLEGQLQYWREHLQGAPAVLNLPTDYARPAVQTWRGSVQTRHLSAELTEALRGLSQKASATLYMTLLAGFQTLLSRYTGQDDIVVGTPIANRTRIEVEELIGFFVNTLVLRAKLDDDPTFLELLARVRETCLEAYLHQDLPFEKLVEELAPERSLDHTPIFQAMFVMQNEESEPAGVAEAVAASGLQLKEVESEQRTAKFDLTLVISERETGLGATLEYSTELFKPETMARLLEQFELLLQSIVSEPERAVSRLELLSSAEQKLLTDWNDTTREYPAAGGMHRLFEAQVQRTPAATALVFGHERLSYSELNRRANSLAHHLRDLGVRPEDRVGILMERTPAMVVSMLAVLKAGGCYVPLDKQYPPERLAFMTTDAGLSLLLSERQLAKSLDSALQVVCVDEWEQRTEIEKDLNVEVSESQLAYVIYTSGSTGQPKGVAITHHSATTFIQWASDIFDQPALSGVLFGTSICFDLSIFELFVTLSNGGKVILAENALQLPALPAAREVTLLNTVPSAMAELVRQRAVPESVFVVNLAGEALSRELVAEIYEATEVDTVYNLYGPSEDTTYSTFTEVRGGERVTIGRPITNTRAYVLDRQWQIVPVGVVGELYLGGEGLARGYWQRPELTAEKFIPDSFSAVGGRLYRTGDLARYLENGELEFLGRADHQVKVRGYRIELGEIESVLRQQEQVREAVVVAREEAGGPRLVAYVVSEAASSAELREQLRQRLPEYMVPAAFVMLDELPLTPNGKIDRKALPAPERETGERARFVAARTPLEELIAEIWREVLGLERISTHDNFFELGGHSLLATRVISRVRALGQVELPLRTLFESPTIAELARRVEDARRSDIGWSQPAVRVVQENGLPLSFAQQRLWFLDQLEPGSSAYNVPAVFRLRGTLDREALARTFTEIVRRHEVLRTSFPATEAEPVQLISDPAAVAFPLIDLSDLPWAEREREARLLAEEEAHASFDLELGPLFRLRLVDLGIDPATAEEQHLLLLTMHHIISDGWSLGVLMREAQQLYSAYRQGQESPLAELALQYGDFSVWQRDWLTGAVLDEQLRYWREQLQGAPPVLSLPTDYARPAVRSWRGAVQRRSLSLMLTRGLKDLSRERGATLFMTLLASFQTLLSRYTGQRDIVVGTPVANRTRVEVEELIGFFTNTLVLRAKLEDDPSFVELLSQVRSTCLEAYTHQDVPFEKLVEELEPERSLSHTPLFQVMFVMQSMAASELASAAESGLQLEIVESENRTAKFDLTLVVDEVSEGLVVNLEYNTDLFDATTMERLLEQFEHLLGSIVSQPELAVSRLALLGREEERQLLREWNDTRREYAAAGGMHRLFEAQVERTPNETALVCGDERLTYRELNERSNQLARHLVQLGVAAEERVGILLERRANLVVSLLGVLKAGGCYVPLDPQYPRERLEFMQADAGLRVLLTTRALAESCGLEASPQLQLVYVDEWAAVESSENLGVTVNEQQLAYLIYTSGSTGVPKGVAITHGNASTFMHWASEVFAPETMRCVLAATSICFDLSIFEIFVTLSRGGQLLLVDNVLQLTALPAEAAREVTLVNTVPSAIAELLRVRALPESVTVVNLAGEALRPELVTEIYAGTQVQQVYNLYGPSEDTTYSTYTLVRAGERVTIGRPIANTRAYVLDEQQQVVPVGVVGELYLSGAGLARGYWQRPELTATKFIPDHLSGEPGGRLYLTGDLARYLANGELEFLGRADQQVKIRGYRIELGEVESVLRQQEQVRDAVVLARETAGESRLVAYVVPADGATLNVSELRAALKQRLPEYMTPAAFVTLAELPLTPNGKLDHRALPEPEDSHVGALETYIAPRNLIELQLARLWEELLRVEPIGVKDNFFELGGHSLLAVRLVSRIQQELGKTIPLTAVFQEATVEHLAGLLRHDDAIVRRPRLIKLHDGTKPPLICVHPAGGSVFSYLNLVQYLDSDQPLYALQAAGLDEDQSVPETIEAMATDYISEIRETLAGPYFLSGWSMGGVVAFEMAQQLQAAGEEVAALTLIDSFAPEGHATAEIDDVALLIGFAQDLGLRAEHVGDVSVDKLVELSVEDQLSFILERATKQQLVPPEVKLADIYRYFSVYRTNMRAMATYVPRAQDVRLTLFKADEQRNGSDAAMGWTKLATQVDVHVVPGNHYTLLREPNVRVLAEHLRACIAQAGATKEAKVTSV